MTPGLDRAPLIRNAIRASEKDNYGGSMEKANREVVASAPISVGQCDHRVRAPNRTMGRRFILAWQRILRQKGRRGPRDTPRHGSMSSRPARPEIFLTQNQTNKVSAWPVLEAEAFPPRKQCPQVRLLQARTQYTGHVYEMGERGRDSHGNPIDNWRIGLLFGDRYAHMPRYALILLCRGRIGHDLAVARPSFRHSGRAYVVVLVVVWVPRRRTRRTRRSNPPSLTTGFLLKTVTCVPLGPMTPGLVHTAPEAERPSGVCSSCNRILGR